VFNSRALFCITSAACYVVHFAMLLLLSLALLLGHCLAESRRRQLDVADHLLEQLVVGNAFQQVLLLLRGIGLACKHRHASLCSYAPNRTEPNRTNPSRSISHSYYHHYYDYYSTLARCGIPLPFLTPPGVSLTLYLNPCNAVYGAHTGIAN
jgi:hypothetical protein